MIIADDLAPKGRQDISNHQADLIVTIVFKQTIFREGTRQNLCYWRVRFLIDNAKMGCEAEI